MTKEFSPHEQALALKELGFNEPCMGYYFYNGSFKEWTINIDNKSDEYTITIQAPTYSQAFRWFRVRHGLNHFVELDVDCEPSHYNAHVQCSLVYHGDNYEEAELACLKKLIELLTKTA
jgi:hypothetical protein